MGSIWGWGWNLINALGALSTIGKEALGVHQRPCSQHPSCLPHPEAQVESPQGACWTICSCCAGSSWPWKRAHMACVSWELTGQPWKIGPGACPACRNTWCGEWGVKRTTTCAFYSPGEDSEARASGEFYVGVLLGCAGKEEVEQVLPLVNVRWRRVPCLGVPAGCLP